MSAVGDLMSSIWSSRFTGVTLYSFLDGYHSALSLAWPLQQVDTCIVLWLFWDDLFGVVILYLDSKLVLWLITTQDSHDAVGLHCFVLCSSETSPSSSLVMKEKSCFFEWYVLHAASALVGPNQAFQIYKGSMHLFFFSQEALCVCWRTPETLNMSEGFPVFYFEPCCQCAIWYISCYTYYVHRCSFPTEFKWSCWVFFSSFECLFIINWKQLVAISTLI